MQHVDTTAGLSQRWAVYSFSLDDNSADEPLRPQRHTLHVLSIGRVHPLLSCYKYPSELLWSPTKFKRLSSAHVLSHSVCAEQMFEGENYFLSFLRLSWCCVKSPPCIMMNSELERVTVDACLLMNSGTSMAIISKHACMRNLHFLRICFPDSMLWLCGSVSDRLAFRMSPCALVCVSQVNAQAYNHSMWICVCSPQASCHKLFLFRHKHKTNISS